MKLLFGFLGALLMMGCSHSSPIPSACANRPTSSGGLPCCNHPTVDRPGTSCNHCPVPTCAGCPGDVAGQTCYPPQPDGGIYGHCIADGNQIEGKVIGAYCCNRTSPDSRGSVISTEIVVDGGCAMQAPPSVGICSVCGDKVCAAWENHCNCPADCP